jgi:hypothetical protein
MHGSLCVRWSERGDLDQSGRVRVHPEPEIIQTRPVIRLPPLHIGILYLVLFCARLYFSLSLVHHDFNNRLELSAHSHINIGYISIFSLNQHYYSRLNHFKIYFVDNKFDKIII